MKTLLSSAILGSTLLLAACDNAQEASKLDEAIDVAEEEIVSLTISSENDKIIFEPSESWQFTAIGKDADGKEVDISEKVNWSLSDGDNASFDDDGTLTTKNFTGLQTVNANIKWGQFEDSLEITLSDASLTDLAVTVTPSTIDECQSAELTATGTYDDGSSRSLGDVTYESKDTNVATVDDDTLITHVSGNVDVSGTKSGINSGDTPVTVSDTLAEININKGTSVSMRTGGTLVLSTTGDYSDGQNGVNITKATSWDSSEPSIATVSSSGTITAKTIGDTVVTASCGGLEKTINVAVLDVTDIIIVSPTSSELDPEDTVQLQLYEVLSDNSRGTNDLADEDKVIWEIEVGDEIADINDEGKVTMADSFDGYSKSFIRITVDYGEYDDEIELFIND